MSREADILPDDSRVSSPGARVEWLPEALLGLAMVVSTWIILDLNSELTFFSDEWDPLLNRTGWGLDQIFAPFNGHPTMIPMVIYKTVQEIFGMDSARPVQIIHAALLLVMNGLLFAYLRRRVGDWAALIGVVMILFLGAAFEVLVYAFSMNFVGAIAAGIGALVALDRNDRKGDIVASALLVVGVFFSILIVPFIVAVTAEWLLDPRDRRKRIFVPGLSVAVLVAWWLVWGHTSEESSVVWSNLVLVPGAALDAVGSGFVSLFGLATGYGSEPDQPNLVWGKLIAIAAVVLAGWRIKVIGRPPPDFLSVTAGLLVYLVMLGMSLSDERQPTLSRYQLPTAILILMVASTLLAGIRLRASWLAAGAIIAVLSAYGGVGLMRERIPDGWQRAALFTRAWLGGVELAGVESAEKRQLTLKMPASVLIGDYMEAASRHGSPALDISEISVLEPTEVAWVDRGLVSGFGLRLNGDAADSAPSTCRPAETGVLVRVVPGDHRIENDSGSEVTVRVARLGPSPGAFVGTVLPDSAAGMKLPAGELDEPWRVSFEPASSSVRLCGPA